MKKGWPLDGPKKNEKGVVYDWQIPSNVDIPLNEGDEEVYCDKLIQGLNRLERMTKQKPSFSKFLLSLGKNFDADDVIILLIFQLPLNDEFHLSRSKHNVM